ncbi:MAG: hypothetical protein ACKO5P_00805 [Nodosilinea sp.]
MTTIQIKTAYSSVPVTLPFLPQEVANVHSKYLRKVARAIGVSPTKTSDSGKRVYKSLNMLRLEMEEYLYKNVPQMDAEVVIEPTPVVEANMSPEAQIEAHVEAVCQDPGTIIVESGFAQKPLKRDSKLAQVAEAMIQGATKEDLKAIVSNPQMYFTWELKAKGLGTKQIGEWFFLVLPQGQTKLAYR